MEYVIQMENITKTFPGVIANDHVNLCVKKQEIHSLLGENGTGKTTLMNILFGLYKKDSGDIYINGKKVDISRPKDAFNLGIGMVHQHFMLIPQMTVLENIVLGQEGVACFLDYKKNRENLQGIIDQFGFKINLDEKVVDLSVGMMQRVEIIKLLYRGADRIILDEPTAVLTPQEVDELIKILNRLKEAGKSIIFITHKLNETMAVADRITVLRKGKNVTTIDKKDTNANELARFMVGREVLFRQDKTEKIPGKTVLALQNVKLQDKTGETVTITVNEGEIVGIAGVEGNGQLELEEMIVGTRKMTEGTLLFEDDDITHESIVKRKERGLAYIPSDRHKNAMLKNFPLWENYLLGYQHLPQYQKHGMIREKEIRKHSTERIDQYRVKANGPDDPIQTLSGGNQQKVILSREISQDPKLILAAQPVRGLDIGAIEYIHGVLLEMREKSKAVLLISAELSEIMNLSDRIVVLYEGKVMAQGPRSDFDMETLGLLMAGKHVKRKGDGNAEDAG